MRDDCLEVLRGASVRLPPGAAFSGLTAAWLHGLDVDPCNPIQATAPPEAGISTRAEMQIRRCKLRRDEVVKARGLQATSVLRTVRDLALRFPLTEAVVVADMALHARLITAPELAKWADRSAGNHGARKLRRLVNYVEPAAESAMETRLRMLLVLARLPRPEAQVAIRDRFHRFLGRPDLYYRDARLGLEYDGGIHREQLAQDNRRQNKLTDAGVRLLRFTAADIYRTPDEVVSLVRGALAA